jgi:predicted HicB family RNase H-like nuclease
MMQYKGYTASVVFDDEAGIFSGQVLNLRDVITFQATSVADLREEFKNSVDDYLEFCAERGESPEKPYSGKFVVRVDPALHRSIATCAAIAGESLNTWVAAALERWVAGINRGQIAISAAQTPYVVYVAGNVSSQGLVHSTKRGDREHQVAVSIPQTQRRISKSRIPQEHLDACLSPVDSILKNVS